MPRRGFDEEHTEQTRRLIDRDKTSARESETRYGDPLRPLPIVVAARAQAVDRSLAIDKEHKPQIRRETTGR